MQKTSIQKKGVMLMLGAGTAAWLALGAGVSARGDTSFRLHITPKLCVVDVVQDGTGQIVQTPSADCEAQLPTLLAEPRPSGNASPLFALPFAGREQLRAGQPLIRPRVDGTLVPIASKTDQASAGMNSGRRLAVTATGVGLAVAVVAVGIDIALFELHYSRSLAKWTRAKTTGRILRK